MLNFKYESCLNAFDSLGYKLEIANIIKEDKRIIEDLKLKTLDFVRSKIAQNTDADSWKISLFTDGEINSEAINLENALTLTIKKETQIHFSFIIFIIENKSALSSYVISASNEETYKYWQSLYMKLKFEGIKMKNAINENVLNFIDRLDTPFIFVTFQRIIQLYRDSALEYEEISRVEEEEEEEDQEENETLITENEEEEGKENDEENKADVIEEDDKLVVSIFVKNINEKLDKETIDYFSNRSFGETIIRDFIKIILYEHSQTIFDQELFNIIFHQFATSMSMFENIFNLLEKENEIIEFNNTINILQQCRAADSRNLFQIILTESIGKEVELSAEKISNSDETEIDNFEEANEEDEESKEDTESKNQEHEVDNPKTTWQRYLSQSFGKIVKAINPSHIKIEKIEDYTPSLESIYGTASRLYQSEDMKSSELIDLQFWIEISKVTIDVEKLKELSELALKTKDCPFFHNIKFQEEMENCIKDSPSSAASKYKFRVFFLNNLLEHHSSGLEKICREINAERLDIASEFWRYSGKILDEILQLAEIKTKHYQKIDYESNTDIFESDEDINPYLEELERVLSKNIDSKFYILIGDRIHRALLDKTITEYIHDESEHILDDDLKQKLEFYLNILKNSTNTLPVLSKLISCCKIKEFLHLYIDFILHPDKYIDEVNITAIYTALFKIDGMSRTFELYVIKKLKQINHGSLARLFQIAQDKKSIPIFKHISQNPQFNIVCSVLPAIFDNEQQRNRVQMLLKIHEENDLLAYLENNRGNQRSICMYSLEVMNKLYLHHVKDERIPKYITDFLEKHKDQMHVLIGKNVYELIMEFANNFKKISRFTMNFSMPEVTPLSLIASFMISIVSSFKNSAFAKVFNIDEKKFDLCTLVFRMTNQSLEYLLLSLRKTLDKKNPADRTVYWKCSEKCKYLIEVKFGYVAISNCPMCNRLLKKSEQGEYQGVFVKNCERGFNQSETLDYIEEITKKSPPLNIDALYGLFDSVAYTNSGSLKRYIFDLISLVNILFYLKLDLIPQEQLNELNTHDINHFEGKLLQYIERLQGLITQNILCSDYYTWMLAFLDKLIDFLPAEEIAIADFENNIERNILLNSSHFKMVTDYKKAYFYSDQSGSHESEGIAVEDIEEISVPDSQFISLFRIKQDSNQDNFIRLFSLHPDKSKYPFIDLFLRYHEKIKILECLFPIISFTNALLSEFSFQISRKEASGKKLKEILNNDSDLEKKFTAFKLAWKNLNIDLIYNEASLNPIVFTDEYSLNYFLVDTNPADKGIYMAAALKCLGTINNEILSSFAKNSDKKTPLYRIQKLKEEDMLKFAFGMKQLLKKSWISNPEYSIGEELIYDFERIEYALRNSLKKGKLLDLSKIECVQYTNEMLNFYSKDSGLINDIRNKIIQEEMSNEVRLGVVKFLEHKDSKDIYNSMIKVLFFTQEFKALDNKTIEDVCQTIKFKLNPLFKSKNPLTSLPLKNIVHLNEILESSSFLILKESIRKEFTNTANRIQIKGHIERCLGKCRELPAKYPNEEEVKSAMMRFIVRYLTLEIDCEHSIIDYIGNTGFWKHSPEQKERINEFLEIFPTALKLSDSLEVFNAIQEYITSEGERKKASESKPKDKKPAKPTGKNTKSKKATKEKW